MQTNKTVIKRLTVLLTVFALSVAALVGTLMANRSQNVVADSSSVSFTLGEAIGKAAYTDEELATAKGDDGTLSNDEKFSLYQLAFSRSPLKFYAGTIYNNHTQYEYYSYVNKSYHYYVGWTNINGISPTANDTTDKRLSSTGSHNIYTDSNQIVWSIAYVAPSNGTLTIPAHTLFLDGGQATTETFSLGWSCDTGNRTTLSPDDKTLNVVAYDGKSDDVTINIPEQIYTLKKGEVVRLNMYSVGGSMWITYNPIYNFVPTVTDVESKSETVTLTEEIAKIGYTDEELAASGWNGTSRDANKQALYKVAFAKSKIKFFAGAGSLDATAWYQTLEYYDWADNGSSYKWSYAAVNGLSVGNNKGTEYGFKASGTHKVGASGAYAQSWVLQYVAPADGIVTIPAHTLNITNLNTATALKYAVTYNKYVTNPYTTSIAYTTYDTTGVINIADQSFEVKAGDTININLYSDGTTGSRGVTIKYNPQFVFTDAVDLIDQSDIIKSVTLTTAGDIGLNYYVALPTIGSAKASLQMTGSGAVVVDGVYDAYKGLWKFTYPVLAKDYDKDVTITLLEVNGVAVEDGATKTYSVKDYIDYVKEDTTGAYDQVEEMIVNLETFSNSANTYFGGAEEVEKVTENVVEKADLATYKASASGSDENVTLIGATLVLESKTSINVYFTATDDSTVCTVNGESVVATKVDGEENLYVISVEVVAQDLSVMQEFVIGGYTINYSAFSYIEAAVDTANNGLYNVLQALYDYGVSAYDYFN